MKARDLMTPDPAVCRGETCVMDVAQLMCKADCGVIPVVDAAGKPIGMVTDRDITCRVVAVGADPREALARDCMTEGPITVGLDVTVEECVELLEQHQLRRLVVVDEEGCCCGIIAQADIARDGSESQTAELVQKVSERRS
jgi:CBS domain-containing protein